MSEFTIPIIGNLLESIAAEFKDRVKPVPGSVLRVDLCGGACSSASASPGSRPDSAR